MRRKILTITFLMTLVFWLGCAGSGGDSNYKVLEEDQPQFETEPDRTGAMAEPAPMPAEATEVAATPETDAVPVLADASVELIATTEPAPDSLDRSYWDRIRVEPYSGKTTHYQSYYKQYGLSHQPKYETMIDDRTEHDLNAALDGAKAGGWNGTNAANAVFIDPAGFAFDTLSISIRGIFSPPWSQTTTPE